MTYLEIKDVAAKLGCSTRAVYREIQHNRLGHVAMPNRKVVTQEQVDAYIKDHTRNSKSTVSGSSKHSKTADELRSAAAKKSIQSH